MLLNLGKRRILPWNRPDAPFTLAGVNAIGGARVEPLVGATSTPNAAVTSILRGGPTTPAQPSTAKTVFAQLTALATVYCATVAVAARQYGIFTPQARSTPRRSRRRHTVGAFDAQLGRFIARRLQINAKIHADDTILELAARQHGVVSRRQLVQAGVSPDKVDGRVRAKRLHPLYRGVYRIGPVVAQYAHEMAAVLACDGLAVVSHRSAAGLWQLMPHRRGAGPVSVILAHSDHGRRPNIEPHCGTPRLTAAQPAAQPRRDELLRTLLVRAAFRMWWPIMRQHAAPQRHGREVPARQRADPLQEAPAVTPPSGSAGDG